MVASVGSGTVLFVARVILVLHRQHLTSQKELIGAPILLSRGSSLLPFVRKDRAFGVT